MAIMRITQSSGKMHLTYGGKPITPEFDPNSAKEVLEALSNAVENAYQKIRDAGIE